MVVPLPLRPCSIDIAPPIDRGRDLGMLPLYVAIAMLVVRMNTKHSYDGDANSDMKFDDE